MTGLTVLVHSQEEAAERTDAVFRTLCSDQYGLDADKISQLLIRNRRRSPVEDDVATILPEPTDPSRAHHLSSSLACPSLLYPAGHPLVRLNTPLYIATDGANPRHDPLTALFRNTFPCVFFLRDFQSINELNEREIPELEFLNRAVDPVGEPLRPFLEPFLEGEVAAKARGVVGSELISLVPSSQGLRLTLIFHQRQHRRSRRSSGRCCTRRTCHRKRRTQTLFSKHDPLWCAPSR